METGYNKSPCEKKSSILKKLESYLSFKGGRSTTKSSSTATNTGKKQLKRQITPTGCFSVYVGPDKQRFVIKTEYANHSLFKMLLEDAELEYGFQSEGPLCLPCDVDLFYKVLAEIMNDKAHGNNKVFDDDDNLNCRRSSLGYGSCSPFNPARRLGKTTGLAKGCGSYGLLTPPMLSKMINQF